MEKKKKNKRILKPSYERIDKRGKLIELINIPGKAWSAINWCSMKKGTFIGNHYHKKTEVFIFLVKGKSQVIIENPYTKKKQNIKLNQGKGIILKPNKPHAVKFLSNSDFLMLKTKYNPNNPDTYKYKVI